MSASPIDQFTSGEFRNVIGDSAALEAKKVKRVVACAGQVYYDLEAARKERDIKTSPLCGWNSCIRSRLKNCAPKWRNTPMRVN